MPSHRLTEGRFRTQAVALALAGAQAACSAHSEPPPRPPASARSVAPASAVRAPAGVLLTRAAWVPPGTFGPHAGVKGDYTVLAWAAEREGKRHWHTLGLGKHGAPLGDPREVGPAPADVDLVAVRPSGGTDSGFLLLSTSREFSGERLDVLALGTRGELLGGPATLSQSQSDIVWVDSIPTAHGSLALWAVRRDDRADLYAAPLGVQGEPRERPAVLLSDALAWQAIPVPNGAALAVLAAGKERGTRGSLSLVFSDEEAHVDKKVALLDGALVEPDVDMAKVGDRLVVAFSDHTGSDARVVGMTVDLSGTVLTRPAPLTPAFGPQTLLRIVPPAAETGPAYLVWENLLEQERGKRFVRIASLARDLTLSANSARLVTRDEAAVPELLATKSGVVALAVAPACPRGSGCDGTSTSPTLVALDPTMKVVASEPLLLPDRSEAASLAWGLGNWGDAPGALVAGPGAPTPIYVAELSAPSDRFEPIAVRSSDIPLPRVQSVETLAKTDRIADIQAVHGDGGELVSWVTDLDPATPFVKTKKPAPDGKYEAPRALLQLYSAATAGGATSSITTLSYRAHSPGGVALSAGDPSRGEALCAWAGVDNHEPQVFLTLLGKGGKKGPQKMLTHGKGGVSDVALAFVGDGWVVAWTDERGAQPQIYVARVDRSLTPVVRERVLSPSPRAQSGVQLLARGEHVFAVWSQAAEGSAAADIFAARLSSKDLGRVGPEHALASTEPHSRTARLTAFGEGAIAAWLEEPLSREHAAPTTVMVARLDSGGEIASGSPTVVSFDGAPTGIDVTCDGSSCRLATTVATEERGAVEVFDFRPGAASVPIRLIPLSSRPRSGTAPVFFGSDLVYGDDRAGGDARTRRLVMGWK